MNMSLAPRLPRKIHLSRSYSNAPRLPSLWNATKPSRFAHVWQGAESLAAARQNDIWTSKSVPNPSVFTLLTSKCSRRNGVPSFNISTSKSGARPSVFNTFDFKMCFAPQGRALFRRLNFQKWSENGVLCAFWLRYVLRATTACTFFGISILRSAPKLTRFVHFDFEIASRHNGVHFFISHLARWLRTRRFSEPTFRPSGARSHKSLEKHSESRLFYLFAHLHLLSSDSFSLWSSLFFSSLLWLFPPLLFHLSILSEVWLLNFLRLDLVGL